MYIVGSTFYMLYFVIGFPMFVRIDEHGSEHTGQNWSIWHTAVESLASAMV